MTHDDHDTETRPAALASVMNRRRALTVLGGLGLATLVGCAKGSETNGAAATSSSSSATSTTTTGASSTTAAAAAACETIPEETAGPYPGDGTNGPNVLTEEGAVRSDIRSSFGSSSGTADGVPLTIDLTILDNASGCTPLAGAAVYLWHCDATGLYSMYSQGATDQNYLRGVQETDKNGGASFTSIFPGAYSGRWPHIHFEVYASVDDATSGGRPIATSQLALPEEQCDLVYASSGYPQSSTNMDRTSLESDNIFRDGHDQQLATTTGSVTEGFVATLSLAV